MELPPTYAAEIALNRQNVAMSVIKASADQQQALAQIIDESARSAPIHSSRGASLNTSA